MCRQFNSGRNHHSILKALFKGFFNTRFYFLLNKFIWKRSITFICFCVFICIITTYFFTINVVFISYYTLMHTFNANFLPRLNYAICVFIIAIKIEIKNIPLEITPKLLRKSLSSDISLAWPPVVFLNSYSETSFFLKSSFVFIFSFNFFIFVYE